MHYIKESLRLSGRRNTIAVVTDGTAVPGHGDIGPETGMAVMVGIKQIERSIVYGKKY